MSRESNPEAQRVRAILADAKRLAVEYYQLTGKPLGVTGEVAEYVAAETLGLTLAPPRTHGYDALRGGERIQIKGRAHGKKTDSGQKMGRIKTDAPFDTALLVLLDNATLTPREMWEASFKAVIDRLAVPGSKARARGVLSVPEFKPSHARFGQRRVPHLKKGRFCTNAKRPINIGFCTVKCPVQKVQAGPAGSASQFPRSTK